MKRIRLERWASQLQPPRNPRLSVSSCQRSLFTHNKPLTASPRICSISHQCEYQRRGVTTKRRVSSTSVRRAKEGEQKEGDETEPSSSHIRGRIEDSQLHDPDVLLDSSVHSSVGRGALNAPSHKSALHSAKLSALHARLSLPSSLSLQTLARCLIDPSVDTRPGYNNAPFAVLGQDLLGYYTAESIMCRYPRLPMPVVFAAQYAYVGSATLAAMRAEWGVETVAAPGPEVDPGLLQLAKVPHPESLVEGTNMQYKDLPSPEPGASSRSKMHARRGMSSRIVHDDQFGDLLDMPTANLDSAPFPGAPISSSTPNEDIDGIITSDQISDLVEQTPDPLLQDTHRTTVEAASASFVRALVGALYLHSGSSAVKAFHKDHILSRHLPLHTLFHFTHPTRDLSRLCAREDLEPPVARLLSETGRLSRTPVFVVGVFSGDEKLGEGAGSSLDEGRVRAAADAMRSWYLYSPPDSEIVLPSEVESSTRTATTSGETNEEERRNRGKEKVKQWKPQMIDVGEVVT